MLKNRQAEKRLDNKNLLEFQRFNTPGHSQCVQVKSGINKNQVKSKFELLNRVLTKNQPKQ